MVDASRPFDDLLVLEAGEVIAPAYAGKLLGEAGAAVVRIDPPTGGPLYRSPPRVGRDPAGLKVGAAYLHLNRGKKSVGLDLATAMGRDAFARLAARADILIDGLGAGRLGACGLPPAALLARHPRLVVASITPFGLTGPYRDLAASDLIVLALGGLLNMVGYPDREPLQLGGAQAQYAAGLSAFTAIAAAVLYRDRAARGQLIDVSVLETVAFTEWKSGAFFDTDRRVRRRGSESQWLVLPARDGHIGLVYQDADWPALQQWTGLEALRDARFATRGARIARAEELRGILTPWFSARTKAEIYHEGQARGIPLGFVATIPDLLASEQYAAHGFWETVDHPAAGPATYPGRPYRAAWTSAPARAPLPGEHTGEVLGSLAGYSADELDHWRSLGVI